MQHKVRITPIIPTFEIQEGPFQTEDEAWEWVERNNCPYVDYDVIPINLEKSTPLSNSLNKQGNQIDTAVELVSGDIDNDKPPWD